MSVFSFPTEVAMANLPALGARMGVRVGGRVLVWESAVRGPGGSLYVRCEADGLPPRHYEGDISLGDAAERYVEEML